VDVFFGVTKKIIAQKRLLCAIFFVILQAITKNQRESNAGLCAFWPEEAIL
jgi:hypothetical protein